MEKINKKKKQQGTHNYFKFAFFKHPHLLCFTYLFLLCFTKNEIKVEILVSHLSILDVPKGQDRLGKATFVLQVI